MRRSPVILEVALNGVTRSEQNPAVPRDPEAIAKDSLACFSAGAAIVHSHTDNPLLAPEAGGALYLEAYRVILDERPDAILYPTMGVGDTIERRYGHHDVLARAGAIRCGVADTGSVNLGATGPDGLPISMDLVYANPPSNIIYMIEGCRRLGLGPSVAIFEPGFLRAPLAYYRAGLKTSVSLELQGFEAVHLSVEGLDSDVVARSLVMRPDWTGKVAGSIDRATSCGRVAAYVVDRSGVLTRLDLSNGRRLWSVKTGDLSGLLPDADAAG